jgi:hypothetical protein
MESLTKVKRAQSKRLVIGLLTAIGAIYGAEAAQANEFRFTLKDG